MPDPNFQPSTWAYEPQSVARARAASEVESLSQQVSPLVAKGDGLSLTIAQQIAQQAQQDPAQALIARNAMHQQIGQHVADNIGQPQDQGFLGGIADAFRAVVPQEARDVLGGAAHALTSGESFGNFLDTAIHHSPFENVSDINAAGTQGTAGTSIGEALGGLPTIGGVARTAFDVGAAPATWATAGGGTLGAAALGDTFLSRIAAETTAGITSKYGGELGQGAAKAVGAPEWAQAGAGIVGGLAGAATGVGLEKGVEGALRGLGGSVDAAALRAADVPRETSLPGGLGTAVPTENGARYIRNVGGGADVPDDIAAIYAKMQSGAQVTQAERMAAEDFIAQTAKTSPSGILNVESESGGLQPDLARTNLIRSRRGLPPLTEEPATWKNAAQEAPSPHAEIVQPEGLPGIIQLQQQMKAEGLTPRQMLADPRFQQLQEQVFGKTPTSVLDEPPPPVRPGGIGEQIGNAIGAKAEPPPEPLIPGRQSPDAGPRIIPPEVDAAFKAADVNAPDPLGAFGEPPVPPTPPSPPGGPPADFPTGQYGDLPNRGRQLGMDVGEAPLERGTLKQNALDLMTAPRQLMASGDLSASFRQAAMAAPSHPRAWWTAMGDQIAAYRNPEAAQAVLDRIDANPLRPYLDKMGIDLTSATGGVLNQEEAFQHGSTMISRALDRVPLVARSERAYTTALNSFRSGIAYDILGSRFTPEQLRALPDDELKALGGFVNAITGRGTLPAALEPHAQTLNALFFAPRNFIGKVQANMAVLSTNPVVRSEAAKSLAAFYGTGIALLGAAHVAGLDVGWNPTSSDFGKITLPGGTRVDIWGGNQQMFRMIANLATGQTTSPRTGQSYDQDRLTTVTRFLRSKLAPIPSTALNVATGSDSGGQDLQYDPGSVASQALRLVTPLFLQDLYDATKNSNPAEGALAGALSGIGIGAQAYQKGPADDQAQAAYGKPYAALSLTERAQLQRDNPGLGEQVMQEQAKSSGPTGQAAAYRLGVQTQQAASDQQLASGQLTARQWQQQRSDRLTKERGALEQIYGAGQPISDQQAQNDPKARYLQAIQQSTDPATGAIDQTKLAATRAGWGEALNKQIDDSMGTTGTPLEQVYRQAAATYYSTPKYLGFTGAEGSAIDRIQSVVQGYAQQIPGDRKLAEQRAFRALSDQGVFDGLPDNVMMGARRALMGALPTSPARQALTRQDPAVAFFFASQLRPGQLGAFQDQAQQVNGAVPRLADGGVSMPFTLAGYAKLEKHG